MSYLEEFKQKIEEERESLIDQYKQFLEDFVLPQAALSATNNAVINSIQFKDNFAKEPFVKWLKAEGFTVTEPTNRTLNIYFG